MYRFEHMSAQTKHNGAVSRDPSATVCHNDEIPKKTTMQLIKWTSLVFCLSHIQE